MSQPSVTRFATALGFEGCHLAARIHRAVHRHAAAERDADPAPERTRPRLEEYEAMAQARGYFV